MNPPRPLAIVTENSYASAAHWHYALPDRARSSTDLNPHSRAMTAGIMLLHFAAIGWLLFMPAPAPIQQHVLSFTVTLTDIASSPNSLSSAASVDSTPAEAPKPEKAVEKVVAEKPAMRPKKVQPVVTPVPKTKAPLSHSAEKQTAVLAPILPAQFDAAYLQNPQPVYPPLSRRMGEQGDVLLSAYVTEEGRAQTVRLRKSSGFDRLDNAAMEAVSRWRFAAAKQGERLIASWVQIPVKFILE